MKHLTQTAARFFAGLQQRFIRARSGSVLILVVALLVILALIGTAWMTAARNDRYGSTQNIANTQIDLLVEGAIALVEGEIVDDMFGSTGIYRMSNDPALTDANPFVRATGYTHSDYPNDLDNGAGGDMWLADRVPVRDPVSTNPSWRHISWPLVTNAGGFPLYDDPTDGLAPFALAPNLKTPLEPASVAYQGKIYPELNGSMAADADGDGIADAWLCRLPIAPIDGVTYYMAYRVIDNSSAVNASIAWQPSVPAAGAPPDFLYGNFFPTNTDLFALLRDGVDAASTATTPDDQMNLLSDYRFDGNYVAGSVNNPISDTGVQRNDPGPPDFVFRSSYDELWSQLGRRLNNPGYVTTADHFQALPIGDAMALAYHFCLVNPDASVSPSVEGSLFASIYGTVPNVVGSGGTIEGQKSYDLNVPSAIEDWMVENFDYETVPGNPLDPGTSTPRRALMTVRNAVSNLIQPKSFVPTTDVNYPQPPAGMTAYTNPPVKTAINNAEFAELWRAFYSAMSDNGTSAPIVESASIARFDPYYGMKFAAASPYGATGAELHDGLMFRSSIRDVRIPFTATQQVRFSPFQQLLLRSAIAAVNAIDLRDNDANVTHRRISLDVLVDTAAPAATDVVVYGTERQPYLTEIYVNTDNLTPGTPGINPKGYIAIELHNPFSDDVLLAPAVGIDGWTIAMIDRRPPTGVTPPQLVNKPAIQLANLDGTPGVPTFHFPPGTVVPANGYLILENYDALGGSPGANPANDAVYRPTNAQNAAIGLGETGVISIADPTKARVFVPNLHRLLQDASDPAPPTGGEFVLLRTRLSTAVSSSGADFNEANLYDLIPVDQFDFTGLALPATAATPPFTLMHYVRANGTGSAWKFVYPGRYDGNLASGRQQGTDADATFVGGAEPAPTTPIALGAADTVASYPDEFVIQLANTGFGGPEDISAPPASFAFGDFSRNGDLLQIPFIGAYCVDAPSPAIDGVLLEMNSVTTDSSFAEDTDVDDDNEENIGRFCPFYWDTGTLPPVVNDFDADGTYDETIADAVSVKWRYRWARDLLDYVTVQAPHDDYFPNVSLSKYQDRGASPAPEAVSNSGGTAGNLDVLDPLGNVNDAEENAEPIHGLININTAPWPVLATLPMVLNTTTGAVDVVPNALLARTIEQYRDVDSDAVAAGNQPHGPFESVFDLLRVPGFRDAMGTIIPDTDEIEDPSGDITPRNFGGGNPDGVTDDFESKFLVLNRISNLITTRSDSFTAYILVQGWRNAESTDPLNPAELVVQRRVGAIIDRSGVVSTDTKSNLSTTRFPQN